MSDNLRVGSASMPAMSIILTDVRSCNEKSWCHVCAEFLEIRYGVDPHSVLCKLEHVTGIKLPASNLERACRPALCHDSESTRA